jgi:hypothetical protein
MRRGNDHRECLRGILSPSNEGTDILFRPQRGDNSTSFSIGDNAKWGKVGELWTYVPYLICQVPPDFTTMINKSISPHTIWIIPYRV